MPWLSDAVWRMWNEGDAEAASFKEPGRPISDAWPTVVTDGDRSRAPRGNIPQGISLPPTGTLEEHLRLLASTPGVGYLSSVHWPVCCDRLTTLIAPSLEGPDIPSIEEQVGPLDLALLDVHREHRESGYWSERLTAMRRGRDGGDGIVAFQCRACGRVYGSFCHP